MRNRAKKRSATY